MLRTICPTTQHHNPADWNIFYMRFLPAKNIKIPCLGCDRVQFDRCGCLRRKNHLHLHGQTRLHTITPHRTVIHAIPTIQQYCSMLALFLLWYLYVCLQSHNTVALFYLFLRTVLMRYIYYQHMFLYISFTSLNYASSLRNASGVNAQFIFQFSSKSLTYRNLMRLLRN